MVPEVIGVAKQLRTVEKTRSLDDLLLSVIDETIKHVFKEAGTNVIYNYIESTCHLKQCEVVEKPEVFSAGLKRLLGSGAPVIEKMILKNLYSMLELKYAEKEGYEFSDHIKELKKRCHG